MERTHDIHSVLLTCYGNIFTGSMITPNIVLWRTCCTCQMTIRAWWMLARMALRVKRLRISNRTCVTVLTALLEKAAKVWDNLIYSVRFSNYKLVVFWLNFYLYANCARRLTFSVDSLHIPWGAPPYETFCWLSSPLVKDVIITWPFN